MEINGVIELAEKYQDWLVDECEACHYCHEPFKECNTLIPGVGVIIGETDVARYKNKFWHHGCIKDWQKETRANG